MSDNRELGMMVARMLRAQSRIAAKALGAEIELTPEDVEAATADAPITAIVGGSAWRPGVRAELGAEVTLGGKTYECIQRHVTQADWPPDVTPALWRVVQAPNAEGEELPWVAGESVATGDRRSYDGKVYKCVTGHTTQAGWEPNAVPALWTAVIV
jgi:hypothetical protein